MIAVTTNMHMIEIGVCVLPFDHDDADMWMVSVKWRGGDQYAVKRMGRVLNHDGEWEHEPIPSGRTGEFKARTRFDFYTACRLAVEQASLVTVNGVTAADVLGHADDEATTS